MSENTKKKRGRDRKETKRVRKEEAIEAESKERKRRES